MNVAWKPQRFSEIRIMSCYVSNNSLPFILVIKSDPILRIVAQTVMLIANVIKDNGTYGADFVCGAAVPDILDKEMNWTVESNHQHEVW